MTLDKNILSSVGNTPLIKVGRCYVKCEFRNPSGSIKDRVAKYLVERAEKDGFLRPGMTIVEATSGNMGNALSFVAAAKGYRMIVVTPKGYSRERIAISRAYGAEVLLVGDFHLNEAVAKAKEYGSKEGYFHTDQFANPLNVEENITCLGEEILRDLPEGVTIDAIVQGVGTGGTLIGVGKALRKHFPKLKIFAVEPAESETIGKGIIARHKIEGISDGFVPEIYQRDASIVDGVIAVSSDESIAMMREIALREALFVGPSSGANLVAAKKIAHMAGIGNVLTFFCDTGKKYIEQHFHH